MRGIYAENISEYTPVENGNSYFTFRLGSLWGVVLDCAEDKVDGHEEYAHTVCCSDFRRRQTAFLERIIERAEEEYQADGVQNRLVICHNPFTRQLKPPFDIEKELYTKWAELLRLHVKPDLMICGHLHTLETRPVGHDADHYGQPCPTVIGGRPTKEGFFGCGYVIDDDRFTIVFTGSDGSCDEHTIER